MTDADRARSNRFRNIIGAALIIIGVVLLIKIAVTNRSKSAIKKPATKTAVVTNGPVSAGQLPAFLSGAPENMANLYRFAGDPKNHDLLRSLTCYCSCDRIGHDSLLECYVKDYDGKEVTYEPHAVNCAICLRENNDAQNWQKEGKNSDEIRALINAKYGDKSITSQIQP